MNLHHPVRGAAAIPLGYSLRRCGNTLGAATLTGGFKHHAPPGSRWGGMVTSSRIPATSTPWATSGNQPHPATATYLVGSLRRRGSGGAGNDTMCVSALRFFLAHDGNDTSTIDGQTYQNYSAGHATSLVNRDVKVAV
jgi:hypothetical protein